MILFWKIEQKNGIDLENQAFSSIDEWAIARRKKVIEVHNINDYIKMNALDLEARYEALMLVMRKKQLGNLSIEKVLFLRCQTINELLSC